MKNQLLLQPSTYIVPRSRN